jgi:polyphenol oxidase
MLEPDWPAPSRVRALVTTRDAGDMAGDKGRQALRARLPAEPRWLRQVHGREVSHDGNALRVGDACVTRTAMSPQAVIVADCMPVFFADEDASVVGVAHAGWRGLAAGVLEASLDAMGVAPGKLIAWMGPAIGPRVYEVGADVFEAFPEKDAFVANRPGHWLLDLYALARARLARRGVRRVSGGGFCTYSDPARFFSHRRERAAGRMAAVIWLA